MNKRTLWLYRLIFVVVLRNIVSFQVSMRNAQAQDLLVSFTSKQVIPSSYAACKRTQQLPALLRQQFWELMRACWQWFANGCNNSQQCWDLQCIVGRIQPISLCKPCVMSMRGPNNVGRAVQTDPTLLRYASAITEQKKCWELLAEKFDQFQTLRNNTQQQPRTYNRVCKRTQHVTSNKVGSCWPAMLRPFARGFRWVCKKGAIFKCKV